ncbi:MAG: alkaline phosphatase family protein [Planctomycetota bacterium]
MSDKVREKGSARVLRAAFLITLVVAISGCQSALWFPAAPDRAVRVEGGDRLVYNLKNRRVAFLQEDGRPPRITEVEILAGGATERVVLADVPASERRHLVIGLDGCPYGVVRDLYDRGLLTMFHEPTPLVSTFPAQTDLSYYKILGGPVPLGFESKYYDRERGKVVSGAMNYVAGTNEPWSRYLDYRLGNFGSAMQFTSPRRFFNRELDELLKRFRESDKPVFTAYFASTAGLGTRYGMTGYVEALQGIDRAVKQLVVEMKGRVDVTLCADHGQTLVPVRQIPLESFLRERGFRVTDELKRPRDVVPIAFGVLTYVALYTDSAAEVAQALVEMPQVEFAVYREGDAVLAASRAGKAAIRRRDGRYRYDPVEGDPLDLVGTTRRLAEEGHADADGYVDDRALFEATAQARYPDACHRLWGAFDGLAVHAPDVLLSLSDDACYGGALFRKLTPVRSTHASLDYQNSVTFVMSTAGKMPGALRVDDLRQALGEMGIAIGER